MTRCLPLQKVNGKRLFVSLYWKNLREQQNILKSAPVFPDGIFQTEIRVTFVKTFR